MKMHTSILSKAIALILIIAVTVSVSACGGKPSVVGKWSYSLNFADNAELLGDNFGSTYSADQVATLLDGVSMDMVFTFEEDGTCTFSVDQSSADAAVAKIIDNFSEALPSLLAAELNIEESKVEEYLESMGVSMSDFEDALTENMDELDFSDMVDTESKYKYENGNIYIDDNGNFSDDEYMAVTLTSNTLTLNEIHTSSASSSDLSTFETLLPMEFKKI